MKKLHLAVAAVGLVAASVAAWWLQNRAPATTRAEGVVATEPAARIASTPSGSAGAGGPASVEVGKVEVMTLTDDAQAVGSLRARQSVVLRPEVSGRIARLGFVDGARVRRGQLLVQLDDNLQAAQLKQAEAQASIARTNLQRSRDLLAQSFVSQSVVDQNLAALQVAEAQVALAQAQLARMKIVAPFDAVAGIRSVNLGDYVKDGADLVGLEDTTSIYVDFRLAERFASRLRAAQVVEVALDAMPAQTYAARVEAVDSQLDANGRSLLVRARMGNTSGALRSGMFARVRVVFATRANALVVPEEALVPQGDKQFVIKVVDGPSGSKVSQRLEARIGLRLPGKVEILEGLSAGDMVVTAGQARLMRGDAMPVRVVDLSQRPGADASTRPASGTSNGGSTAAKPGSPV